MDANDESWHSHLHALGDDDGVSRDLQNVQDAVRTLSAEFQRHRQSTEFARIHGRAECDTMYGDVGFSSELSADDTEYVCNDMDWRERLIDTGGCCVLAAIRFEEGGKSLQYYAEFNATLDFCVLHV